MRSEEIVDNYLNRVHTPNGNGILCGWKTIHGQIRVIVQHRESEINNDPVLRLATFWVEGEDELIPACEPRQPAVILADFQERFTYIAYPPELVKVLP